MIQANKERILLIITNSYAATNVIHSGLIKPLAQKYNIYIISDLINKNEIGVINQHFDIEVQNIEISVPTEDNLVKILRWLEKAFFFHFFQIETQKIKEKHKGFWYIVALQTIFGLTSFFSLNAIILKFIRQAIINRTKSNTSLNELRNYNFCGVISSSPLDIRENIIVNFLKKSHIPSLAMIISWDNLSSKGIINADHDYILVWNNLMLKEYKRFYTLFNPVYPQVFTTGIPRFDIYFGELPEEYSISRFREKHKIGPVDKVILFATSAANHFRNQADIVMHLLEFAALKGNTKIVVRCHASDNFEQYEIFRNEENLRIWHPHDISNSTPVSGWMPDLNILYSLAEMLKNCDVCINVASTIRLEAMVCNKPGINITYDGEQNPGFHHSVKRFYAYSHQIPLNALEIDSMVFSKNELFDTLNNLLYNDLQLKSINNSEKIEDFISHPGSAVSTTMNYVSQWLG